MIVYPDNILRILTRETIARNTLKKKLGIPRIEELTGSGKVGQVFCARALCRYDVALTQVMPVCPKAFRRSGSSQGGKNPLRFCDEVIMFLG